MNTNTTRRAVMAGLAAAPVAGLPALAGVVADNEVLFAISEIKRFEELSCERSEALEDAEYEAAKAHGRRPWSLIEWRHYSAIGGHEIDRARDEFLQLLDTDPEKIEAEYQDAKRRELAAERAGREWDERAGLTALRQEDESMWDRILAARRHLATTAPSTPAAAAALLDYVADDMENGKCDWHSKAIATVAKALRSWSSS